jgi:hypothetical protein
LSVEGRDTAEAERVLELLRKTLNTLQDRLDLKGKLVCWPIWRA